MRDNYRIGIVGGMGPMAGVFLQELIIKNTPVEKDQDHIEVICYTNPTIPDRTNSLENDDGHEYVAAVNKSVKILEEAGADCILLPCNTAHARFEEIQNASQVPVLNMIDIALQAVREWGASRIGILGTDGTIRSGVFESDESINIILPDAALQKEIMSLIYAIKKGKYDDNGIVGEINKFSALLKASGAEKIILGCTELSLYFSRIENKDVIDPLAELAKAAVRFAFSKMLRTSSTRYVA